MHIEELEELVAMHPEAEAAGKELGKGNGRHLWLSGLYASARSMLLSAIQQKTARPMVVVTDNADEAQYMYSDLQTMHNAQCTMHNAQCTMHNAQCAMHNAECTMHNAQCTMHNAQCTMHNAQCTMHNA